MVCTGCRRGPAYCVLGLFLSCPSCRWFGLFGRLLSLTACGHCAGLRFVVGFLSLAAEGYPGLVFFIVDDHLEIEYLG